jgi:pimeloyl-ACP methyl ester carboxylesterase
MMFNVGTTNAGTVIVAVLAVVLFFALNTISPEKPQFVASTEDATKGLVRFLGGDGTTSLTGYMHLPNLQDSTTETPVIVLAQGMGLVQGSGLTPFVEAFQSAGFAVFTFDYATFGASDGFPRHQVHPNRHVSDIQAAIAMIKEKGKKDFHVDVKNIGLWGTSLGGGHVLRVASENDPSIKAVVSQVPHVASGLESILGSLIRTPRNACMGIIKFALGLVKWLLVWSENKPGKSAYFPLVGQPGSAAMMQNPGDEQGYSYLVRDAGEYGWKNAATTDSGIHVLTYRPMNVVASIKSPVLLVAAEKDTLCPAKFVQQAKERIQGAELLVLPNVGHFDVYQGAALETMLAAEVDFFKKHML